MGKWFRIVLLLLVFGPAARAQNLTLQAALGRLEQQFHVVFNATDAVWQTPAAPPAPTQWPLIQQLQWIEAQYQRHIEAIDGRYYVVKLPAPNEVCVWLRCIDAQSGEPIEGVEIVTPTQQRLGYTNAQGQLWAWGPQGPWWAHRLGYAHTKIDRSTLHLPLDIHMPLLATPLEVVTTRPYLTQGMSLLKNGGIDVNPNKFKLLAGMVEPETLQTVQLIPGIFSVDDKVSNLSVRGGTHDQNLFLWNGMRLYQTGHFFGMISAFNPAALQNIKVYKSGMAAWYGEGVSSVVDVYNPLRNEGRNTYSAGVNALSVDAAVQCALGRRHYLAVALRRSTTDIWTSPTFALYRRRIFENSVLDPNLNTNINSSTQAGPFWFADAQWQYRWQVTDGWALRVDGIGFKNQLSAQQWSNSRYVDHLLDQQSYAIGVRIEQAQAEAKRQWWVQAYQSRYGVQAQSSQLGLLWQNSQSNVLLDRCVQGQMQQQWDRLGQTVLGFQIHEWNIDNYNRNSSPEVSQQLTQTTHAYSAIVQWEKGDADQGLYGRMGLRSTWQSALQQWRTEPRLYVSYPWHKVHWYAAWELSSQLLSQQIEANADFLGIDKRRWIMANGQMYPQLQSQQWSVGGQRSQGPWLYQCEAFYKYVQGISTLEQGFQQNAAWQRYEGAYRIVGVEQLLQFQKSAWGAWVSYSWQQSRYEFDAWNPAVFPNSFAVTHALRGSLRYTWKGIQWALGGQFRSGAPYTALYGINPTSSGLVLGPTNQNQLPDMVQWQASVAKSWAWGRSKLVWSMSVLNMTDKQNVLQRQYQWLPSTQQAQLTETHGLPLTTNMALRWTFQ